MTDRHPYQPMTRADKYGSYLTAFCCALIAAALIAATYIALAPMFATPS